MENKDGIISFSKKTTDIVDFFNKQLLKEDRLSTNPNLLMFHSYDAYDIVNDKTPDDSICRFTIHCLKHIFPLIKIELGENDEIIVEDKTLDNWSAFCGKENHTIYIKEIMLDIFNLYQNDETKIPLKMYNWYFNKK